jgi:hypothetical protein
MNMKGTHLCDFLQQRLLDVIEGNVRIVQAKRLGSQLRTGDGDSLVVYISHKVWGFEHLSHLPAALPANERNSRRRAESVPQILEATAIQCAGACSTKNSRVHTD